MYRQTAIFLLAAALVGGCASGRGGARSTAASARASSVEQPPAEAMTDTQLAAHAGDAQFPSFRPQDDARVAAIVTPDRRLIKIYNFDRAPLRAVNVWVNGAYVQPVRGIPGQSKLAIRTDKLYNKLGNTFSSRGEEVARVQLETREGLYEVMGPGAE